VFAATPAWVDETYWPNTTGGNKTTGLINNLTGVTALTSFYDPPVGQRHVFSATPAGDYETY
jgi:hypothetical protein